MGCLKSRTWSHQATQSQELSIQDIFIATATTDDPVISRVYAWPLSDISISRAGSYLGLISPLLPKSLSVSDSFDLSCYQDT